MPAPLSFDIAETEVDPPLGKWCASGHTAPEVFKRTGPDSPAEPTRFFLVQAGDVCGIYCEPCLVIANHIARMKKQGKM